MKRIISILLILAALPHLAHAAGMVNPGELLTLERCLNIAAKNHPSVAAQKGAITAAQGRLGQAESSYFPQVNASGGYSRVHPTTSTGFGNGTFDQFSGSLSLSQNIYDFGRTGTTVRIQKLNLSASETDLGNVTSQILFTVKQAYFGLLQAQRNRVVAVDAVRQFEQHLAQARGFYEVGTKPKFDVTKAEVDLSNSRLNLLRAENAISLARVNLNNAMGEPTAPEYVVEDNLSFQKFPITLDEAIGTAYKTRPDLLSIVSRRMAAEAAVERAKRDYLPFFTGNASASTGGNRLSSMEEGWSIGVGISLPVFNGFLTRSQINEARGNLETAAGNEAVLRQNILLDVQQAFLNLTVAENSIATTELAVQQATENFEIATGRYAAGVGNPIEVTDAEVLLANARTANIQALYDYKVSRASLERAMGLQ